MTKKTARPPGPLCECLNGDTHGTDDPRWRRCDLCGGLIATDQRTDKTEPARFPPGTRVRQARPDGGFWEGTVEHIGPLGVWVRFDDGSTGGYGARDEHKLETVTGG